MTRREYSIGNSAHSLLLIQRFRYQMRAVPGQLTWYRSATLGLSPSHNTRDLPALPSFGIFSAFQQDMWPASTWLSMGLIPCSSCPCGQGIFRISLDGWHLGTRADSVTCPVPRQGSLLDCCQKFLFCRNHGHKVFIVVLSGGALPYWGVSFGGLERKYPLSSVFQFNSGMNHSADWKNRFSLFSFYEFFGFPSGHRLKFSDKMHFFALFLIYQMASDENLRVTKEDDSNEIELTFSSSVLIGVGFQSGHWLRISK